MLIERELSDDNNGFQLEIDQYCLDAFTTNLLGSGAKGKLCMQHFLDVSCSQIVTLEVGLN